MPQITTIRHATWVGPASGAAAAEAVAALEAGDVLYLPELRFELRRDELSLCSPAVGSAAKNVSFDPAADRIKGAQLDPAAGEALHGLMARFSRDAAAVVAALAPAYDGGVRPGRTSFRPVEIAGRETSWRKDDTRLHIDAFPSSPVQGRRILRLFANVDPDGRPRSWRIGDEFEAAARGFAPRLRVPPAWTGGVLRLLRVTRSRRSAYDGVMLRLHDAMKRDTAYQAAAPQQAFAFPAGTVWMAFTDQVSHAAMAGQHLLEQTFIVDLRVMREERRAPVRVLERILGRRLI